MSMRRARSERSTPGLFEARTAAPASSATALYRVQAGIDEAGLGPLLGPLTLGVAALRLPAPDCDPWRALEERVTREPSLDATHLVVADSKQVFARHPRGERRLEHAVLAFLAQRPAGRGVPGTARALCDSFAPGIAPPDALADEFWAGELATLALPRQLARAEVEASARELGALLARQGLELLELGVRALSVPQLNASFSCTENKSRTHWLETRALVLHLWERYGAEGLALLVDRQGGRLHYRALLEEAFPGALVRTLCETAPHSEYTVDAPARAGSPVRSLRIAFRERAEGHSFAVALASCSAKYVRELAMAAFNAWWSARAPGLVPTAGYVSDARRWLAQADQAIASAGIARAALVRER